MNKIIKTKIEKLVFGGQALGRYEDKVVFCWNALPGEEVEIDVTKQKKNFIEGVAVNILKPSKDRIEAKEDHFLSCSPWQILSFEKENEWKLKIAKETYEKIGKFTVPDDFEIISAKSKQYGYRNKIEYSFWHDDDNQINLAFFERGKHFKHAIDECVLADLSINKTAKKILDWLNTENIKRGMLKSLIIRSNSKKQTVASLFVKDVLEFKSYPKLDKNFLGFQIYFSNPQSPASRPDQIIYDIGQNFLLEKLNKIDLKYGLLSFFQVNIPLFKKTLTDISKFLDKKSSVVDYYSGVGAVSLSLHDKFKDCVLVDNAPEAIEYAQDNIKENKIANCEAKLISSEKILELIKKNKIIIFDPPRAGLHQNIVQKVLEEKPKKIIYLSCNLSTQARDIELLKSEYKVEFLKLYNFFPRTPHIEGLCVLERK